MFFVSLKKEDLCAQQLAELAIEFWAESAYPNARVELQTIDISRKIGWDRSSTKVKGYAVVDNLVLRFEFPRIIVDEKLGSAYVFYPKIWTTSNDMQEWSRLQNSRLHRVLFARNAHTQGNWAVSLMVPEDEKVRDLHTVISERSTGALLASSGLSQH